MHKLHYFWVASLVFRYTKNHFWCNENIFIIPKVLSVTPKYFRYTKIFPLHQNISVASKYFRCIKIFPLHQKALHQRHFSLHKNIFVTSKSTPPKALSVASKYFRCIKILFVTSKYFRCIKKHSTKGTFRCTETLSVAPKS